VRIRPAREEDAAAVSALWTEAYSGRHPEGRQDPYEEAEFFAALEAGQVGRRRRGAGRGPRRWGGLYLPVDAPGTAVATAGEAEFGRPFQAEAHRIYESLGYRRVPKRDSRDAQGPRQIFVLDLTDRR
jgi:hypothetical protein